MDQISNAQMNKPSFNDLTNLKHELIDQIRDKISESIDIFK